MSGTVTVEELINGPIKRITFTWTSNASGQASGPTLNSYDGTVTAVALVPGTTTTQPDNNYDVTLTDSVGTDLLNNYGQNNSNSADHNLTQLQIGDLPAFTAGLLTLNVTGAGDANSGTVIVYIFGTTNSYCTLSQFKTRLDSEGLSANIPDDAVMEAMIEQASRVMDLLAGHVFYAYLDTKYFDMPEGRELKLNADLISATTVTNGDSSVISASDFIYINRNYKPYYAIRLKKGSGLYWTFDSDSNTEQVISIYGYWGYVDRTASDPESMKIIKATENICLAIVMNEYKKRYGANATGTATITAAGVVITPDDIPALQRKALVSLTVKD